MAPTLFADGNVISNDSHELTKFPYPHATAHGGWVRTGSTIMRAVFVWMNLTGDPQVPPNGFLGTLKVVLNGVVDKQDPNRMCSTLNAYLYPPDQNPLDPDPRGIDAGICQIEELRRVRPFQRGLNWAPLT